LDVQTRESVTAPILDLPPRPRAYSEKGMGVTILACVRNVGTVLTLRYACGAHI